MHPKLSWLMPALACLVLAVIASCVTDRSSTSPTPTTYEVEELGLFLEGEGQTGNRCCVHSVTIVPSTTHPVGPLPRDGHEMLRFELRYDDPDVAFGSRRAEITMASAWRGLGKLDGRSEWYGFSVYLPKDHEPDPATEIVAQWHARPDRGEVFRSPVLSLHSREGAWQIINRHSSVEIQTSNDGHRQRLWQAPYQTGVWTDFIFQTRWDWRPDGDGALNVWMKPATSDEWQEILAYRGPTAYRDGRDIYFKAGLYKWPWAGCRAGDPVETCSGNGSPVPSSVERRVLYLDAIHAVSSDDIDLEQFARIMLEGTGG